MKAPKAPAGGYVSGPKKQFRRDVWAFIDGALAAAEVECGVVAPSPKRERTVLILESTTGREVEELLRRGYSSGHIHVVNKNPAVVAVVQRHFRSDPRGRGDLVTYGRPLNDVVHDCKRRGVQFDAIHLDFTSCLADGVLADIGAAASLVKPGGCLVTTVQRGREIGTVRDTLMSVGDGDPYRSDSLRVAMIARAASIADRPMDQNGCRWHFGRTKWDVYRGTNSRVSMLWLGVQMIPHNHEGAVSIFGTLDPFTPSCVTLALELHHLKPSPELLVIYQYRNGRGERRFWSGDLAGAMGCVSATSGSPVRFGWERPQRLEQWRARTV